MHYRKVAVFHIVVPSSLVEVYCHLRVLVASIIRAIKSQYTSTKLNGSSTQRTAIFILAAGRKNAYKHTGDDQAVL
jgi:hypothetical protein